MAFTDLYMQSTGNNVNAGSTIADAASVTSTNGSWDMTADTFIATGGTPFSGVGVGEWASVYIDGATSAVYVAQVTALHAAGLGVVLSTTAKYGTKPAASATVRSCKIGGAWASLAVVTSLFASVAVPAATRVNIKAATYANTTTARAFASAGLTTGPLWWRGYKTTPGDMDGVETVARVSGTDIPLFTWTTSNFSTAGVHQTFSNLAFQNAHTAVLATLSGTNVQMVRCVLENTNAAAGSSAVSVTAVSVLFEQCFIKATTTANNVVSQSTNGLRLLGCTIVGGLAGIDLSGTVASSMVLHSVIRGAAGPGIAFSGPSPHAVIANCTVIGCTGSGIYMTALPLSLLVHSCLFINNGAYGIHNNSGANTNRITRFGNSFYNNTSGNEAGLVDSLTCFEQSEVALPVVSTTDLKLLTGALGKGTGLPGLFEGEVYQSYLDIGAVQRQEASGGPLIGGRLS